MFLNKKILSLIPARGGSKGIKYKNLKKIGKKSLVENSIRFAKSLKFLDKIIVSSDYYKILNIAKSLNVSCHLRSKKLSKDFISDYQVIRNVLKKYKNYDYILYLQPTSPFRKKKDIIKALTQLIKKKCHGSWSVTPVDTKHHPKKILKIENKKFIKTYTKSGTKIVARQQLDEVFIRNGIFYIFSVKEIINQKTIYLKKTLYYKINYKYFNIDTNQDLQKSRILAKELKYKL